jgi:hypothetical protein
VSITLSRRHFFDILFQSNVDSDHIAGILYFHGTKDIKPQNLPFDHSRGFLGLSDGDLSRKCLIVATGKVVPSADQVASENGLKSRREFRTTHFDGTQDSAWSAVRLLLDEPQASELPAARAVSPRSTLNSDPSSSTLLGSAELYSEPSPLPNDVEAYIESGIAARRHHDMVVVLIVGNSGHGKSKMINRLVGRNLLDVGRSTLGSTTKVEIVFYKFCRTLKHKSRT